MTIKELEERLGMTRANIRFYEQEGLLTPARTPNGYRDYSEADIHTLEKIKLLRQLQFDLDTIRALQAGELALPDALADQLGQLDADQAALEGSRSVCTRLRDTAVSFETLDAAPWLRELGQLPDSQRFAAPKDELPPAPGHPWRRYFARSFDMSIYRAIMILVWVFLIPLSSGAHIEDVPYYDIIGNFRNFLIPRNLLITYAPYLLMLVIEPLLLHKFGTTLGKALFGIKIHNSEGQKLSLSDAFSRTLKMFIWGYGLGIPYYCDWRLFRSFVIADGDKRNRWEYSSGNKQLEQYIIPGGWKRCVPYIVATALIWSANVIQNLGVFTSIPPNNYYGSYFNDLTEAEFQENYQYYLNRYYSDRLDDLERYPGEWTTILSEGYTTEIIRSYENEDDELILEHQDEYVPPSPIAFQYTLRAPVSFFQEYDYPNSYQLAPSAGLLAYAGAMPGESFITFRPQKMMNILIDQGLNYDFTFEMSSRGSWGKWYESTGGSSIIVYDFTVYTSQSVIRESTGEAVYSAFDIENPDEWLILTFTVGKSKYVRS